MKSNGQVSHFFPCSGKSDAFCGHDVKGVFDLYSYCLKNVTLSGPTYFGPLLEQVVIQTRAAYQMDPNTYNILLILTDGAIYDMEITKDWIIEGSELPLSIIIVGIGQADFGLMEELDSDDQVVKG